MAEFIPQQDIDSRRDMALAYLACSLRGVRPEQLDAELVKEYLRIRRVMSPKSLPMRVAGAVPIRCSISSISLEESSQRFLIEFTADGSDTSEQIRSDRVDGRRGDEVRAMWGAVVPGTRAVIYKTNENQSAERSSGYRVAPYVVPLSR